ncbi:hypothetical protein AVEN_233844-1, partial [Araneus ventricosus]
INLSNDLSRPRKVGFILYKTILPLPRDHFRKRPHSSHGGGGHWIRRPCLCLVIVLTNVPALPKQEGIILDKTTLFQMIILANNPDFPGKEEIILDKTTLCLMIILANNPDFPGEEEIILDKTTLCLMIILANNPDFPGEEEIILDKTTLPRYQSIE